jgi:hypothetical protein
MLGCQEGLLQLERASKNTAEAADHEDSLHNALGHGG